MRKLWVGLAVAVGVSTAVAGGLVACGAAPSVDSGNILTETLPNDVTAKGVLLAAVILSSGDINQAVSKGIVTVNEVTAARDAILANTMELWKQRAENDVKAATP